MPSWIVSRRLQRVSRLTEDGSTELSRKAAERRGSGLTFTESNPHTKMALRATSERAGER